MKKIISYLLAVSIALPLFSQCIIDGTRGAKVKDEFSGERNETVSVVYQQSDELFSNPERGFHSHTSCRLGAQYGGLNENMLRSLRARNISLLGRLFYLHEFRDRPLSAQAMEQIDN